MSFTLTTRLFLAVLSISLCAAAQNDPQEQTPQSPADSQPQPVRSDTAPAPAFGQNAPILNPENPPLSGLDEPRLEMRSALRSFISPALQVSTSADTNSGNQPGTSSVSSVSRVLGAFDLQRFWPKTDLFAEYLGGGAFYTSGAETVRQLQALGVLGTTRWRTGQVSLRDSFSYLPEGSFSTGAFGGAPGLGIAAGGGNSGIPGGGLPGIRSLNGPSSSLGLVPRIDNTTIGDVVQSLTPRSAVTAAGGYGFDHFTEDQPGLINSQQITVQGGYSYMLNRRDQAAIIYAFQEVHFPQEAGGQVNTHVINLRWGRTITGRMSIVIGAGPQYTSIYHPASAGNPSTTDTRWSVSGRAHLNYKFSRSSGSLSYEKYTSPGSGFFAGADTQVGRLSYDKPLGRTWQFLADAGISYSKRIQEFLGVGVGANHYTDAFAGAVFHKQMGRNFGVFAAYRFSDLTFDSSFCQNATGTCNRITLRHIGSIGVDWHPRPVRIE